MIRVKFKNKKDRAVFLNEVCDKALMTMEEYENSVDQYIFDARISTANINYVETKTYTLYWKEVPIKVVTEFDVSPCPIEGEIKKKLLVLLSENESQII